MCNILGVFTWGRGSGSTTAMTGLDMGRVSFAGSVYYGTFCEGHCCVSFLCKDQRNDSAVADEKTQGLVRKEWYTTCGHYRLKRISEKS